MINDLVIKYMSIFLTDFSLSINKHHLKCLVQYDLMIIISNMIGFNHLCKYMLKAFAVQKKIKIKISIHTKLSLIMK